MSTSSTSSTHSSNLTDGAHRDRPRPRRFGRVITIVTITLSGLRGQSRRLATTALAVMLGVAFTAGTLVLTDSLGESFDGMHVDAHANIDLAVRRPASFGDGPDATRARIDADLVATVAAVDGVVAAAGRTSGWAQLTGADGTLLGDIASGVDPIGENWISDERLNPWRLVAGSPPSAGEVVIDRSAAAELSASVGDSIDVLALGGRHTMSVSGIASFGDADDRFGTVTVMFDDATAQHLLGERGRHDSVIVALDDATAADVIAAEIRSSVGAAHEVVTGETLVAEARALHLQDWGFFDTVMKGFAAIALVVGGFIIFNTFSITVAQRTREFALVRALGAGRGQVLGSVVAESLAIGVLASVAGLVGGVGVAAGLRSLFAVAGLELPDGGMIVDQGSLAAAFVVGVAVTTLSALVPAVRAARTAPIAAMRDAAVDTVDLDIWAGSPTRMVVGAFVTVAGAGTMAAGLAGASDDPIILVGLGGFAVFGGIATLGPVLAGPFGRLLGGPIAAMRGVPGRLARDNVIRSPKRTASTAAALMIGVGLVGFITILAGSIKASIDDMVGAGVTADIVVESGSFGFGGLDRSLVAELRSLPEVAAVAGSTLASVEIDGRVTDVIGIDSSDYAQLIDLGATEGSLAGPDGTGLGLDRMAVNAEIAAERGWSVGTPIPVTLADGRARTLTVGAVVEDPYIGLPTMIDTALLEASGQQPYDVQVFVAAADGVDPDLALAAVAAAAERLPNARVLDRASFAEDRSGLVDPLLGVVYALLAFAVFIATLGIANTLALSIMERTREIGVLRAIGATRSQVRAAVRWESVMIAGFGTALGLVIGAAFGWAIVRALEAEGINRLVIPTVPLAIVAAVSVATGVGAAVLPARRGARLDVLEALRS